MRTRAYFFGHPLHPMLVPFPFAFLTGALVFDTLGLIGEDPSFAKTGSYLTIAGLGAGLLAAVPGVIDYFGSVPPNSSAKQRATKHALLNSTALVLFAIIWFTRFDGVVTRSIVITEFAGVVLLGAAGWMGGTLVYRNQMGVDHRYAGAGKWKEIRHAGGEALARSGDLALNQMMLVHRGDERLVVGRTEDGCRAFDDRCTHKGGPLSDGALICGTVQCPWHGSQFDVATGEVKAGPATQKIRTHHVAESNGQIRVD